MLPWAAVGRLERAANRCADLEGDAAPDISKKLVDYSEVIKPRMKSNDLFKKQPHIIVDARTFGDILSDVHHFSSYLAVSNGNFRGVCSDQSHGN